MATFRQILKQKRQTGQGILSSVGGAAAGSTLEKIDPRNYLFKSGSIFNALFPKVKGYRAISDTTKKLATSPSSMLSSTEVSILSEKLDIIGKNTVAIPSMARDMFLVKENIIKLVKLQGGTPRKKSGDWFSRQLARENLLEEKMEKKSTAPTSTAESTRDKPKGFFSSMLGFLTGFLGEGLVSMLIKGGLLVGILTLIGKGIREFFSSEEFRAKVMESIGNAISSSWKFLTETDVGKSLLTGVAAVVGAFAVLKGAIWALKTTIMKVIAILGAKLGLGAAAAGAAGAVRKRGAGKIGAAASILGALGLGAYALRGATESREEGQGDGIGISEGVAAAGSAALAYGAYKTMKTKPGPYRDPKTGRFVKTPVTKWTRFLTFLEKRSPKLFGIVGKRLAALGAGFAVPGIGWLWSLLTILGSISLAWEVYSLWKEFSKQDTNKEISPTVESIASTENAESKMKDLGVDESPSPVTFKDLTIEQQNAILDEQFKREGNKPGNLAYDLNNPGAMLYSPWMSKFGGTRDPNRGQGNLKGKFAKFPSLQHGREAQRYLWLRDYGNLPLNQAVNRWTTGKLKGDGSIELENYKRGIFASIDKPTTSSLENKPSVLGSTINSASVQMRDLMRDERRAQVVNNQTTNNVVNNQQGAARSAATADVFDGDLIKLLLSTQS